MPWKERSIMSQREELVALVGSGAGTISSLCGRFDISRQTAHKWVKRHKLEGPTGLNDRARKPRHSPGQCAADVERAVLAVRTAHPAWGGRKIRPVSLHSEKYGLRRPARSRRSCVVTA